MKRLYFLIILTSIFLLIVSCKKNRSETIILDSHDPLALAVDVEWAVVTDPYVTFHEDKEWNTKQNGHVKKGEVLKVTGYSYSSTNEKWVKFENGYLPLKSVSIYTNKFQAENASRSFEEK